MQSLFLALPIVLAAYLKDESVSGYVDTSVEYQLVELAGSTFPASASIAFPKAGRVTGEGPCNRFQAAQAVPYPWIEIRGLTATKRACPDLAAELEFFAALQAMTLAEINGNILILSNDAGLEMVFRAQ